MLVGGILGSKKGAASVLLYIAEGCLGLPVFAMGHAGLFYFMGPTGGYLVGFVLQAYLVGWFFELPIKFNSAKILGFLFIADFAQMLMGLLWLAHFVGWDYVFVAGFLPFVPGTVVKTVAVANYLQFHKNKFNE